MSSHRFPSPFDPPSGGAITIPRGILVAWVALAFILAGCGDDETTPTGPGGGPSSTQLTGTYLNGSESGLMTLSVSTATLAPAPPGALVHTDLVNATATLSPSDGSGVTILNGTYDTATDSLHLSGGGYTFSGTHGTAGVFAPMSGQYSGPNGQGLFGCLIGSTGTVEVYCGTFTAIGTQLMGNWNIAILGSGIVGIAYPSAPGATPISFQGSVQGTTLTFSGSYEGPTEGVVLTGTGTLDRSKQIAGGTWTITLDNVPQSSGTWNGELCREGTTGSPPLALRSR